jgi:hypothetical protein
VGDEVVGAISAAGPGGDLDDACARAGRDWIKLARASFGCESRILLL